MKFEGRNWELNQAGQGRAVRCGGAESGLMRGSRQGRRRGGGHGDSAATERAQSLLDISWKSTGTCSEFLETVLIHVYSPRFSWVEVK
jgi:hypothetical protein